MIKPYTENIIAISLIKGVGSAFMKKHLSMLINYRDNIDLLTSIGGKVTLDEFNNCIGQAKSILEECKNNQINIITIADELYPNLLLEIKNPPPILYYKGNIKNIEKPIALIGTRKASNLGIRIAEKISNHFNNDFSICNGLAEGIDKATVQKNEKTIKGAVGILAGGLNLKQTLNKKSAKLALSVLENDGLLITEFEPNKKEDSFSSIKACRIQAGLSKGLILIQSPNDGGSKYTIKTFSELNRPLAVIDFRGNDEFETNHLFSANRNLIENQINGLAEIAEIKKINSIRTKEIISISSLKDYEKLNQKMMAVANNRYDVITPSS